MKQEVLDGRTIRFEEVQTDRELQIKIAYKMLSEFIQKTPQTEVERVLAALCVLMLQGTEYEQ